MIQCALKENPPQSTLNIPTHYHFDIPHLSH